MNRYKRPPERRQERLSEQKKQEQAEQEAKKAENTAVDEELPAEETTAEAGAEEQTEAAAEQPKNEAEAALEKELAETKDRYLRLMAEYENYRRRTQREKEAVYPEAVAATVKELLPVLDNFERALEAACTDENYRKGVEMIYNSLQETLKKMGLTAFGEAGESFDPKVHNAVMHIENPELGKNVVAQVFQKGYRIEERILRHAMVQTAN